MKPRYFLMRHGDAGEGYPDEAADRARHLTPAGQATVRDAGARMAQKNHQPTAVYSDDSNRCIETAQIMAEQFGFKPEIDTRLATSDTARQAIADHTGGGARPLFVTHDHVITDLSGDFVGVDPPGKGEIRRMKGRRERARY